MIRDRSKLTNAVISRIERADQITELQVEKTNELLLRMGIDETHPDRETIFAAVMQSMAINYLATVTAASSG